MGLSTAGLNHLLGLGIGEALTSFANANAYVGVGDSSTAFAIAQTDLQAASNKTRKACDSTYPSRASNVLTARATFSTSDANYTWSEFALFNASSSGVMLHRGVSASFFVKNSSTTAVLTTTLTLTAA